MNKSFFTKNIVTCVRFSVGFVYLCTFFVVKQTELERRINYLSENVYIVGFFLVIKGLKINFPDPAQT